MFMYAVVIVTNDAPDAQVGLVAALGQKEKVKVSGRDNTLSILQKRKMEEVASTSLQKSAASPSAIDDKNDLECIDADVLPFNWKAIFDLKSGAYYYWNKQSNETSWISPRVSIAEKEDKEKEDKKTVPSGWKEIVHPATKQIYYLNSASGEKSFTFPEHEMR